MDLPTLDDLRISVHTAEAAYGPHHPYTARALASLASAAQRAGRHDESELAGRRALAIMLTQPQPDRAALGAVLHDLGGLYEAMGRRADADQALQQAASLLASPVADSH